MLVLTCDGNNANSQSLDASQAVSSPLHGLPSSLLLAAVKPIVAFRHSRVTRNPGLGCYSASHHLCFFDR